jgi:hypothetical protein
VRHCKSLRKEIMQWCAQKINLVLREYRSSFSILAAKQNL